MNFEIRNLSSALMVPLLFLIATATLQTAQAQHPVRWTKAVGPPSREALRAKFNKRVKSFGGPKIYDHKRQIRTCVDYQRALKNGWEWTGIDSEQFTWGIFEEECKTIALVLVAKPSGKSYVRNFKLNDAALDVLPPTLASDFNADADDPEAARKAEQKGISWRKFRPGLKIQQTFDNGITVMEQDIDEQGKPDPEQGAEVYLEIRAFGDFNGDGIEDVLVWTTDHIVPGTLRGWRPVVLTRLSPGGPLKEVEIEDAEIDRAMARASRALTARPSKARPQNRPATGVGRISQIQPKATERGVK
jgi:hypothetical protein